MIKFAGGILLKGGGVDVLFDPQTVERREGTQMSFISHAHGDHIQGVKKRRSVMTEMTKLLAETYVGRIGNYTRIAYGKQMNINDDCSVSAFPAGHVLGSTQYLVESPQGTVAYTGDINTYDTLLTVGAQPIQAEQLIIEATFGLPLFKFPNREGVYAEIVRWATRKIKENRIPCFNVYPVGKAQEIIGIFNQYSTVPVVVSKRIERVCEVYEGFGQRLHYVTEEGEEGVETTRTREFAYVSGLRGEARRIPKSEQAIATGWALKYPFTRTYDAAFPLSGHSDYYGLLDYVESTNPRTVFTVYGHCEALANMLRRKNYDAKALHPEAGGTTTLDGFIYPRKRRSTGTQRQE